MYIHSINVKDTSIFKISKISFYVFLERSLKIKRKELQVLYWATSFANNDVTVTYFVISKW